MTSPLLFTMSQKRKGDEVLAPKTPSVVLGRHASKRSSESINMFTPRPTGPLDMLRAMKSTWVGEEKEDADPFLATISSIEISSTNAQTELRQQSEQIQQRLQQQIQQEESAAQSESQDLNALEQSLQHLRQTKEGLHVEIDNLRQKQDQLQSRISRYQQEASYEIETMDQVEENLKRHVPRLRTQISMYGRVTGIKWEYSSENILSGQVAIPSQHGFKNFSLDVRDFSRYEIADYLWTAMNGGESMQ